MALCRERAGSTCAGEVVNGKKAEDQIFSRRWRLRDPDREAPCLVRHARLQDGSLRRCTTRPRRIFRWTRAARKPYTRASNARGGRRGGESRPPRPPAWHSAEHLPRLVSGRASVPARPLNRAVLAAAVLAAAAGRAAAADRYNVLLVSLDSVRQDFVGCYGHRPRRAPDVPVTPEIDRLAALGVRMADAYASSSWTLPSHVSLLTGEPEVVHGVDTDQQSLDASVPTLAELLKRHGYRTAGVFSGPYLEPHWGFGRGFDRYRAAYGRKVA